MNTQVQSVIAATRLFVVVTQNHFWPYFTYLMNSPTQLWSGLEANVTKKTTQVVRQSELFIKLILCHICIQVHLCIFTIQPLKYIYRWPVQYSDKYSFLYSEMIQSLLSMNVVYVLPMNACHCFFFFYLLPGFYLQLNVINLNVILPFGADKHGRTSSFFFFPPRPLVTFSHAYFPAYCHLL